MRDGQRSDGAYPDVAPHSWVGYGQAAWADAGIIVPWTIYLMYDNKKDIAGQLCIYGEIHGVPVPSKRRRL